MARKHKARSTLKVRKRVLREARQRLDLNKKTLRGTEELKSDVQGEILENQEILLDCNSTNKECINARERIDFLRGVLRNIDQSIALRQGDISQGNYWIPRIETQEDQPLNLSNISQEAQRQNRKHIQSVRKRTS